MMKIIIPFFSLLSLNSYALINGIDVLESDPLGKSVVAIQMVEKLNGGQINYYKGSGVLVRQDVVLTAGHNFFYLADATASEALFSTHPTWGSDPLGQKRISVKKVFIYPGFSQSSLGTQNDLALVFLQEPAPDNYKPLEIELDGAYPPNASEKGVLLGYGRSIQDSNVPPSDYHLRRLDLKFARWDSSSVLDSQKMWFSNQDGSIAAGDSGGPALFKGDSNAYKVYGIGIHQRYDACVKVASCEAESAYTNTTYFADWIRASLQSSPWP